MCITEYDEVKTMQAFENEGVKKGIDIGIEKERLSAITNLLNKGFSKSVILGLGYTEDALSKVTSNPTQHIDVPAPIEL